MFIALWSVFLFYYFVFNSLDEFSTLANAKQNRLWRLNVRETYDSIAIMCICYCLRNICNAALIQYLWIYTSIMDDLPFGRRAVTFIVLYWIIDTWTVRWWLQSLLRKLNMHICHVIRFDWAANHLLHVCVNSIYRTKKTIIETDTFAAWAIYVWSIPANLALCLLCLVLEFLFLRCWFTHFTHISSFLLPLIFYSFVAVVVVVVALYTVCIWVRFCMMWFLVFGSASFTPSIYLTNWMAKDALRYEPPSERTSEKKKK